jgi:hypothetical protein
MSQQDIILRAIEQIAAAIARAFGFVQTAHYDDALEAVREGKGALPIVPGMVDYMDPEALFQLLGAENTLALASLLNAEADALDGLKRTARADRARQRAEQLIALLSGSVERAAGSVPTTWHARVWRGASGSR